MKVRFTKMHGLGNDFMLINQIAYPIKISPKTIKQLAHRNTGIGFDQLLILNAPTDPKADFHYQIFNADGSEAEQCLNGARCFAKFTNIEKLTYKKSLHIQTSSSIMHAVLIDDDQVCIELPTPNLAPKLSIPPTSSNDYHIKIGNDTILFHPASLGNPHAIIFVDSLEKTDVENIGSALSTNNIFPNGANISFCQVINKNEAYLRVFERGCGETLACGSAACATAAIGHNIGHFNSLVNIHLPGGTLNVESKADCIRLTGEAIFVYEGIIDL